MYHQRTGYYFEEEHRGSVGFLVGAIILSLCVHLLFMHNFSEVVLTGNIPKAAIPKRENKPTSLLAEAILEETLPENPFAEKLDFEGSALDNDVRELASGPEIDLSAPRIVENTLNEAREIPILETVPTLSSSEGFVPREDILRITERLADDNLAVIPRLEIDEIDRVFNAPDFAPPQAFTEITQAAPLPLPESIAEPVLPLPEVLETIEEPEIEEVTELVTKEEIIERVVEKPSEITEIKSVDNRLSASVTACMAGNEIFFKVSVLPTKSAELPCVPKDIIFVQDASRSLAEERLRPCKDAISELIGNLGKSDRFNIALFRDKTEFCFTDWADVNAQNIADARTFLSTIHTQGNTDVFRSLTSLFELKRDAKRPLIVILLTDGKATAGLVRSTEIIGEFSKQNDNISVYAVGIQRKANGYLLDVLTKCNRGTSEIVTDGVWDIKPKIQTLVNKASRPILGRVTITASGDVDIHPNPPSNLFADKPLDFYGKCPANMREIVLQVRGEGGNVKCDCVFEIDFTKAQMGDVKLVKNWAEHKMYSLLGEYARNPNIKIKQEMNFIGQRYKVQVPYLSEL